MASSSNESVSLQFIKSKRGKQKLIRAGYQYNLNIRNKNGSSNWRCINREICNGSITINSDNTHILGERQHCCKPNQLKNKIDARMDICKDRVQKEFQSIPKIFEECFESMDESASDSDDYSKIPEFSSKSNALYNARKKAFHISKCKFQTTSEVRIPEILKTDFLVHDTEPDEDFLVFTSPFFIKTCMETDLFMGDGTFQTVPPPYYQLFTLHIDSGSSRTYTSIVPAIFCLLPNKQQSTYIKLFTFLKHKLNINIKFFKCDYEQAIINAVKECYPEVKISGCYFHFKRAVIRKAKELNMMTCKELKKIVYLTCNLALLPQNYVPEGWLTINKKLPDCSTAKQFSDYFVGQWMHKISANVWCCAQDRHRTTNSLEAWHNRLKLKCNNKENLFLYVHTLKKEGKFYERKIKTKQTSKRKTEAMKRDQKIEDEINQLMTGKITVEKCLRHLCWL